MAQQEKMDKLVARLKLRKSIDNPMGIVRKVLGSQKSKPVKVSRATRRKIKRS